MDKGPKWTFSQRHIDNIINKYMKRCSTSLIIREMQIKSAMRYNFTPLKGSYRKGE